MSGFFKELRDQWLPKTIPEWILAFVVFLAIFTAGTFWLGIMKVCWLFILA